MPSRSRKRPAPPRQSGQIIIHSADDFVRRELAKRGWTPDAVTHILNGHAFAVGEGHGNIALAAGCDNQPERGHDAPRNVEACLRALRTSVALAGKLAEDLAGRLGPILSPTAPTPSGSVPPTPGVPLSLTPLAAHINDTTSASNATAGLLSELLARAEI